MYGFPYYGFYPFPCLLGLNDNTHCVTTNHSQEDVLCYTNAYIFAIRFYISSFSLQTIYQRQYCAMLGFVTYYITMYMQIKNDI